LTGRHVTPSSINPDVWVRHGRGKVVHFKASDDEVICALNSALPHEYAPYVLLASSLRKVEKKYRSNCEVISFDDIPRLVREGVWQYVICSLRLTRLPDFTQLDFADGWLATNGLINLQHGRIGKKGPAPSSFGIVDKVRNVESGEIRTHRDYLKVYKALTRLIKSEGRVSTAMG
jgi:hypothetical protein